MPSRWYQSLYWRVAITFVLCLAAMLVVQGVLFVWVVSRAGPTLPGQSPERFGQTVSRDLGDAFDRDPSLNVDAFLREQFGRDAHPFFVMLADGRVISNGGPFPEQFLRVARVALQRAGDIGRRGGDFRGPPPLPPDRTSQGDAGGPPPFQGPPPPGRGAEPPGPRDETALFGGRDRGGPGGDPFRPSRPVPVFANGKVVAVVVVPPVAPFPFLLRRYAPTLALVAGGALVVGALLAAVAIFGPTRRRLRSVEDAARRLGAGDLTARVPAHGGDEVAAVASAFNAMADDLAGRAEALARSDRVRRQLLADVSHELTTPVTAMRGYLETLSMPELNLDETTRARYLGIVGEETGRLEHIIGDLLELARLEGGGGAIAPEQVSVEQLFARIQARHELAAREAGVQVRLTVESGAEYIHGDRQRLEQAIQNLAANALRYAPAGTAVDLQASVAGDATITIAVTDRGPGIAADDLPHIFDRFFKADPSRAATPERASDERSHAGSGGSGLGLSIVRAIVERHGGRVSAVSQPGKTTFEVTGLPRV